MRREFERERDVGRDGGRDGGRNVDAERARDKDLASASREEDGSEVDKDANNRPIPEFIMCDRNAE